jgi:pilus assembly protein TadC
LLAGTAGVAVGVLVGGGAGAALGIAVTVGGERLLRTRAAGDGQAARSALVRELPAACDLLGVCLTAGVPVAGAMAAVGEAAPAPLGPELRGVAALYRMGADPRQAWAGVPSELAGLGRVLVRAGESGSTAAPALRALAAESRAAARAATEAAVRRAGVWVLAPLGLCFLPAFVCLGVVPLILGIAGDVFG